MMRLFITIFSIGVLAVTLPGCTPITAAAGVGAGVGIAAAQEGGIKTSITDKAIHLKISDLWISHEPDIYRKLNLNVKEGRVLLAGSVPTADMRVDAVRLAWQADGVRQVINEITIDDGHGLVGVVKDSWIASNLKSQLVFDKHVQSINYNIETVNGTVYLMGIAQDNHELDRVLNLARNTRSVENVVSYVRLRGEQMAPVFDSPAAPATRPLPATIEPVTAAPLDDDWG